MKYPMGTIRKSRLEATHELVLAAGARFKSPKLSIDTLRDRVVEADVEVKERKFLKASPIATIQHVSRGEVESAGDHPSTNPSFYPFHAMPETLHHFLEESWL